MIVVSMQFARIWQAPLLVVAKLGMKPIIVINVLQLMLACLISMADTIVTISTSALMIITIVVLPLFALITMVPLNVHLKRAQEIVLNSKTLKILVVGH